LAGAEAGATCSDIVFDVCLSGVDGA
jgi:hypothetical protein